MKNKKKIRTTGLLVLLSWLFPLFGYSQFPQDTITLSTAQSGGEIKACQSIKLKSGFSFKPSSGKSLVLKVDPTLCNIYVQGDVSLSANQNYIIKVAPLEKTTKTDIYDIARNVSSLVTIQYFDGLGRPVETVQHGAGGQGQDLVTLQEYDNAGRAWKNYLPTPATSNTGAYVDNLPSLATSKYSDSNAYSETVYEQSPLNRIKEQYGPGANWRSGTGHKVAVEYLTNKSGDATLSCPNYSATDGNNFSKSADYATGQLYVTKTTDEDGNISYEFKDKLGRVLLQRRMSGSVKYDTNYVYDDFGNLTFILPPVASDSLTANQAYGFWDTSKFNIPANVYAFYYDERRRRNTQVIAGKTIEPFVFDAADRLVMIQTAAYAVPSGRGWLFKKYDAFGRIVLSGIYHGDDNSKNNDNTRVSDMRSKFKTIVSKESASSSSNDFYYTWGTFPSKDQSEVTEVYFYDNYTYAAAGNDTLTYKDKSGYGASYSSAKGLLTGTWERLLDGSGWIKTTYYYDAWGNPVQKRSINQKGGYDYEYYAYNYANQVTNKYTEHTVSGQAMIKEEYAYTYDKQSRLMSVNYKFNGGASVNIAEYQYNDLGQVKEKKTGGGKETATFKYNLRGLETEQSGQRFSENLYYESGHPKSGGTVYWGGNVSALTWKAEPIATTIRGYGFKYDALGWLTNATYGEGAALGSGTLKYDETFTYNKNGNIKTLKRYGMKDDSKFGLIDDLTVTEYFGNFIRRISDAAGNQNSSDVMEFKKTYTGSEADYVYANGALMSDYNKNICMFRYNYLQLPQSVQFRRGDRIEYVYDAAGVKRQVTRKVSKLDLNYPNWSPNEPKASDFDANKTVTTDYIGNKIYVNNQLKYILTEEGYVEKSGTTYNAYYYLNDHLGSHRIVMDASGTVKQVNNFYPSGTSMAERRDDQGVQPYKFIGKELDRTNNLDFYDFENRAFDPVLMRFNRTDPMAEKYAWMSSLAYCNNNPVNNVDSNGKDWYRHDESGAVIWQEGNAVSITIQDQAYNNIGTTYTDNYNGGATTYEQNEAVSMTETILNPSDFHSQMNSDGTKKSGQEGNCFYQSGLMVAESGTESLGGTSNDISTYTGMLDYLDSQADAGYSTRVHIDRNDDGSGDHWVAISSRTTNLRTNSTVSFGFFDPGTSSPNAGTSSTNLFTVGTTTLSGNTAYSGNSYVIVNVRRNR